MVTRTQCWPLIGCCDSITLGPGLRFPWGSQIVQTGVLCAAGDVIAQVRSGVGENISKCYLMLQLAVEKKGLEKFELARVGRFFIMGSGVVCPFVR